MSVMMPALFLSDGAPPLVDDELWVSQLVAWASDLPIIGSGFTTHGLPYLTDHTPAADAPGWSPEFDAWAAERFAAGDLDALVDFRAKAPGMPYARPTIEHFAPLFVALGASGDRGQAPAQVVDGFWMGLAKRSLQLA